jgi:hypothetical protein
MCYQEKLVVVWSVMLWSLELGLMALLESEASNLAKVGQLRWNVYAAVFKVLSSLARKKVQSTG